MTAERKEKILIIGDLPRKYLAEWEITSDLALAEDRLKVHVERIGSEELLARHENLAPSELEEARALAERLVEGSSGRSPFPVPMAEVEKAARVCIALENVAAQHGADAVSLDCGPLFASRDASLPCAALALLQDAGIAAGCQIDIDALLTMVLFKRITDLPTFLGGPLASEGRLAVSHCSMPLTMCGPDAGEQPYRLGGHHGSGADPTIRTGLPAGTTVTLARLTRNAEELILTSGKVADSRAEIEGSPCCNTLLVEVPNLPRILSLIKGFQYHLVAACGDHTVRMAELARELAIEVVPPEEQTDAVSAP